MHAGKTKKLQFARELPLDLIAFGLAQAVPLVHHHDQRPPRLQNEAGDVRVLLLISC
jgi:hypothetical protein